MSIFGDFREVAKSAKIKLTRKSPNIQYVFNFWRRQKMLWYQITLFRHHMQTPRQNTGLNFICKVHWKCFIFWQMDKHLIVWVCSGFRRQLFTYDLWQFTRLKGRGGLFGMTNVQSVQHQNLQLPFHGFKRKCGCSPFVSEKTDFKDEIVSVTHQSHLVEYEIHFRYQHQAQVVARKV